MASISIRKAIGLMKDQTSISIAKVTNNLDPEIEVLVVKATSHDEDVANEKYLREIFMRTRTNRILINGCVFLTSKRLSKTQDWIVALKGLMLVHRLIVEGNEIFKQEIAFACLKGSRMLNLSGFRDEAHSNSWDFTQFVKRYAVFLEEKVEFLVFEKVLNADDDGGSTTMNGLEGKGSESNGGMKDFKPQMHFNRMKLLHQLLDRVLFCRPSGFAKGNRLVMAALYPVVKDSFRIYDDICDGLTFMLDQFYEFDYVETVMAYETYVSASRQIDELIEFYGWCKRVGIGRPSEYPEVHRVSGRVLSTLESFLKEKARRTKGDQGEEVESSSAIVKSAVEDEGLNSNKLLPPPQNGKQGSQPQPVVADLVDLKDDTTIEEQDNKLSLALFSETAATNTNGWELTPLNGVAKLTSAWQTPAAELGKADWELVLVESASNLAKQKPELAGGFDPLLLNGMYDQGTVNQHMNSAQQNSGSSSSVALALPGNNGTQMLALPTPDGTMHTVNEDPFAASLAVPPPSYVQLADMERKRQLLVQEQEIWEQYGSNGIMQHNSTLAKMSSGSGCCGIAESHAVTGNGIPNIMGQPYI